MRVVAYGVPVLAATAAGRAVAELDTGAPLVVRTLFGLTVAILASLLVSRLTMRLLPLAVLLKMTMIFPDQAPSRYRVARAAGGVNDLQRRLASPDRDEQEAATLMLSLVTALGRHDRRTRGHSERVRLFSDLLATELGLDAAAAGRLRWAALVHDIGKLQVPVAVLANQGALSAKEWGLIRLHPVDGARLAAPLEAWLGPWFAGIEQHHERFDGTGYPRGLSGEPSSRSRCPGCCGRWGRSPLCSTCPSCAGSGRGAVAWWTWPVRRWPAPRKRRGPRRSRSPSARFPSRPRWRSAP